MAVRYYMVVHQSKVEIGTPSYISNANLAIEENKGWLRWVVL
jgi:hypothetical protein